MALETGWPTAMKENTTTLSGNTNLSTFSISSCQFPLT